MWVEVVLRIARSFSALNAKARGPECETPNVLLCKNGVGSITHITFY
jgi:hypothetical protein